MLFANPPPFKHALTGEVGPREVSIATFVPRYDVAWEKPQDTFKLNSGHDKLSYSSNPTSIVGDTFRLMPLQVQRVACEL